MVNERIYQPGESYDYPLIIKKLLVTPLRISPDNEILYRDQKRYTYRDLEKRIHRLANGLTGLGISPGDTIAFMDWDSNRYLEAYFAVPMMGAVLQMVNWRLSAEHIIYTINHAESKVLFIHSDFLPLWEKASAHLPGIKKVVIIKDDDTPLSTDANIDVEYEELLAGAEDFYDFPDLDEDTKATTFYTTGTTGNPKGVHFTHKQLVIHTLVTTIFAGSYENLGGFRSKDVYMPLTPMFHVHAWGYPYVVTMLGAKQVYPGRYEPEMLVKLIETEKVTYSHCVPTVMQMVFGTPSAQNADFSNWKVCIGGAPLSKGLALEAMKKGIDIVSGYGMSETCPVICASMPKDHMMEWDDERLSDILIKTGVPAPLVELEVMDHEDNILPHDGKSTGEVVMRTPWLTKSYFKEPEKTKDLWRSGWLHSGDVGYIDEEGYLTITDRIKDVIKSGGEWISSLALEDVMSRHPAVFESAAVGVPDAKWGERPMMLVTLRPDEKDNVTIEDLKNHMNQAAENGLLPKYGVPDKYVLVDEIPKTSVGKINKKQIRTDYA